MTETEIIQRAQAGDEHAFRLILERHVPTITGYFAGAVPPSSIEDLVQEVFISAFRNIRALKHSDKLGPWLLGIAHNKRVDFYRSQARSRKAKDAARSQAATIPPHSPADTPDARAEASHVRALTLSALGGMKHTYRVVLYLRLFEELSYVEIADRLGIPDSTVRVRARRGLERLRRTLERDGLTADALKGGRI